MRARLKSAGVKFVDYWKNVLIDYREAFKDIAKGCEQRPLRALTLTTAFSAALYANSTNPNERSFRDNYVRLNHDLLTTSEATRRKSSEIFQNGLNRSLNENVLRYWNLGLFSVVWKDNFDSDCANYEARCEYLQVGYLDRFSGDRLVDIGFLGRWWLAEGAMKDFDVNDTEWAEDGSPKKSQWALST